jgi:hypothetical protein
MENDQSGRQCQDYETDERIVIGSGDRKQHPRTVNHRVEEHGDKNVPVCVFKQPDDDDPQGNCAQAMPEYPVGAAARLIERDDMP